MIPLTTPPGTKVRVREDAKSHYNLLFLDWMDQYRGKVFTIKELKRNFKVEECERSFHPSWLDLVEESKRVQVVTETKTVVKEVIVRIPVNVAKTITTMIGIGGEWDSVRQEIRQAIADAEAGK